MKNKIKKLFIKSAFLALVPVGIASVHLLDKINNITFNKQKNLSLQTNKTNLALQTNQINLKNKFSISNSVANVPIKNSGQNISINNQLKNISLIVQRSDPKKINFYISDFKNIAKEKIIFPNLTSFYNPSDEQVLQNQINKSINNLYSIILENLKKQINFYIKDLNNTIRITSIKPKIQWVQTNGTFDTRYPSNDPNSSIALGHQIYYTYQAQGYKTIVTPVSSPPKNWNYVDDNDVEIQYNCYDKNWNAKTTDWHKVPNNLNFIPTDSKKYNWAKIRLANDHSINFSLKTFNYGNEWMRQPNEINDLDKNKKVNFNVGDSGDSTSTIIKKEGIVSAKKFYRSVIQIEAEFMPQIKFNEKTFEISNKIDEVLIKNEAKYIYLTIDKKGQNQSIIDAKTFKTTKEKIINYLDELVNNKYYKKIINQYLNKKNNEVLTQLKVEENIISSKYGIKQYHYKIPEEIVTTYNTYFVNKNENKLSNIYKYKGIANLIANKLRLDPNYGVKFKTSKQVYKNGDENKVGLKFKLEDEFVDGIKEIKKINKMIKQLKEPEDNKFKNLLINFKINSENAQKIFELKKEKNKYFEAIKNFDLSNSHELVYKIQKIISDSNKILDEDMINFYHELPDLVDDLLEQVTIKADIKYSDNTIIKTNLFELGKFKFIDIEDIKYNNQENISNNKVQISLLNIYFENQIYKSENIGKIDYNELLKEYGQNNTIISNINSLTYQIYYRKNFKNIGHINSKNPEFKINFNIDNYGFLATDYFNNYLEDTKKDLIKSTIQNNLNSSNGNLIINSKEIEIIDKKSLIENKEFNQNLNQLIDKYQINLNPNNKTGSFYAIVKIKNSNDLKFFKANDNSEIYPNSLWFLKQDELNLNMRYYLVKFYASKKILSINDSKIQTDLNKIAFVNDGSEIFKLNLEKNEFNEISNIQNLKIPEDKYLKIEFDNETSAHLINQIELSLAKFNILLNTNKSFFDFNSKSLHLEIFKLNDLKQKNNETFNLQIHSINKNLKEKIIEINYTLDSAQIKKIEINYEIDIKNQLIHLKNSSKFNKDLIQIYYEPFKIKINQEITKQLNQIIQAKDQNMSVKNFDINLFENPDNEIKIEKNNNNFINNQKENNNLIKILLGVLIPCIFIAIGSIIYLFKKKKQKIK